MKNFRLNGLVAAPYTPFDRDGELHLRAIEDQASLLVDSGVGGAFICGTTGEGASLTTEERMAVARQWMKVAGGRLKVIVHVGHNSQRDAIALAHHAGQIGAAAVAALPPFFYKPSDVKQVVAFCEPVAAAAGELPFYYYHIPSMTGVNVSMVELLAHATERIPTLRGIKYTHGDLMEYRQCLTLEGGRFDVPFGRDEMLLAALGYGARGAVGSTYNYAGSAYLKMMRAFAAGDLAAAREVGDDVTRLVELLRDLGEIPAGKAIMTWLGVACGPPRLPLKPLTASQQARLEGFLTSSRLVEGGARCNGKAAEPVGSVSVTR